MDILPYLEGFVKEISEGRIEIYNEASIQFELAIYLRKNLSKEYKIQLERNIQYFGIYFLLKKEMDIVIFTSDMKEKYCIELKFVSFFGLSPTTMYDACKDIYFLEQLIHSSFNKCYFMGFVTGNMFYNDKNDHILYKMFKGERLIEGQIDGQSKRQFAIKLKGAYKIEWKTLRNTAKYVIIPVAN